MFRNLYRCDVLGALLAMVSATACSGSEEFAYAEVEGSVGQAHVTQSNADLFYSMDHVVKVEVTMNQAQWEALKVEQPKGGFDYVGDRFDERDVSSVKITYGSTSKTYSSDVQVQKKSFAGSFDGSPTGKPAFKVKLPNSAMADLGTKQIVLNNSKQDASFIRQHLAYRLFEKAALPHSRSNFAVVYVNGEKVAGNGVYINVEPIKDSYIENPNNGFTHRVADGTDRGNLYEFECDDFVTDRKQYIDAEKLSKYTNKNDLQVAMDTIALNNITETDKVVDLDEFIKFYAMEALLKHWDGYTIKGNNTYFYNDANAVSSPTATPSQINFKPIPWGVDQVLNPTSDAQGEHFRIADQNTPESGKRIAEQVRADPSRSQQLYDQIKEYREDVFSRSLIEGEYEDFIQQMQDTLSGLGIDASAEINVVRQQLKLARSAALRWGGFSSSRAVYLLDKTKGYAIHASDVEMIVDNPDPTVDLFETVNRAPEDSRSDRWFFFSGNAQMGAFSIRNEKYLRWLHAPKNLRTPQNHGFIGTQEAVDDFYGSQDWSFIPDDEHDLKITGYFALRNARTGEYVHFSNGGDPTPQGRPRVYGSSEPTMLYWY